MSHYDYLFYIFIKFNTKFYTKIIILQLKLRIFKLSRTIQVH